MICFVIARIQCSAWMARCIMGATPATKDAISALGGLAVFILETDEGNFILRVDQDAFRSAT
jgi:hypothetical protein